MAMFDTHEEIATALSAASVECFVGDNFVELPIPGADLTGTLQIVEGWLVFKVYLGEWHLNEAACRSLLRLHDRLIGFRFSWVDGNDLWVLQDFPIATLSNDFAPYLRSVFWVLEAVAGTVMGYLASDQQISEDEIDAMFERLDAARIN